MFPTGLTYHWALGGGVFPFWMVPHPRPRSSFPGASAPGWGTFLSSTPVFIMGHAIGRPFPIQLLSFLNLIL